jgi:hypothetical protein
MDRAASQRPAPSAVPAGTTVSPPPKKKGAIRTLTGCLALCAFSVLLSNAVVARLQQRSATNDDVIVPPPPKRNPDLTVVARETRTADQEAVRLLGSGDIEGGIRVLREAGDSLVHPTTAYVVVKDEIEEVRDAIFWTEVIQVNRGAMTRGGVASLMLSLYQTANAKRFSGDVVNNGQHFPRTLDHVTTFDVKLFLSTQSVENDQPIASLIQMPGADRPHITFPDEFIRAHSGEEVSGWSY